MTRFKIEEQSSNRHSFLLTLLFMHNCNVVTSCMHSTMRKSSRFFLQKIALKSRHFMISYDASALHIKSHNSQCWSFCSFSPINLRSLTFWFSCCYDATLIINQSSKCKYNCVYKNIIWWLISIIILIIISHDSKEVT